VRIVVRDDTGAPVVITDRFTAKVIGLLVVALGLIIDASLFIFVAPEVRQKPGYPLVVIVPSLPIFAFGVFLMLRAKRLKEEED
jgi:hypothetical protein